MRFLEGLAPRTIVLSVSLITFLGLERFNIRFSGSAFTEIFAKIFYFTVFTVTTCTGTSYLLRSTFGVRRVEGPRGLAIERRFGDVTSGILGT